VASQEKVAYSNYDLDDWQWEFLRRNAGYIEAYKAVEWLNRKLDQKLAANKFFKGDFTLFRFTFCFSHIGIPDPRGVHDRWYGHKNFRRVWKYHDSFVTEGNGRIHRYSNLRHHWVTTNPHRELPSPNLSVGELRERFPKNIPVYEIPPHVPEEAWDLWWTPSNKYEIAVGIDTRYPTSKITSELKKILGEHKANQRQQLKLYPSYITVWDLRSEVLTDTQIAQRLWPDEYATNGGRDSGTGDKGSLIQRVYDYYDAVKKLIDNSFQRRSPKIKK
jgi:hypothetical protein